MQPDGSGLEVFARGVRNTVGFDWDPATHELWFTDNGRDSLGDDSPPDELNRAPRKGMDFGFPYCHGENISDPEFGKKHPCSEFTPPEQQLPAHVAALGMRFYTGSLFPPEYRNQIFIAEHGSWNRSQKIGYRISCVKLSDGRPASYEVFAEGWLQGEKAWGRPVDVLVMPDGALLVSDDEAGVLYRISYGPTGAMKSRTSSGQSSGAASRRLAALGIAGTTSARTAPRASSMRPSWSASRAVAIPTSGVRKTSSDSLCK